MSDDPHRKTILSRRATFIAAALASAGIGSTMPACGGETDSSSRRSDAGDAQPQPCLDIAPDAEPQPCLGALPEDAGPATPDATPDAEPRPCLKMALDAATEDDAGDAEPQPCLTPY